MKEIDSNAFAYPNGTIVIFEGLLKTIKSENALAFVLAHEVGHYAHRDHFKTMLELGLYSILSSIVDGMMTIPSTAVQARFSQNTETAADLYALDVLYKRYGHVGGATEFFSTIHHNDFEGLALFASHPLSKKRIEVLRARIKEKQFPEKATILL
jgi:Zn-dependent protease with chaperone function